MGSLHLLFSFFPLHSRFSLPISVFIVFGLGVFLNVFNPRGDRCQVRMFTFHPAPVMALESRLLLLFQS